MTVSDVLHRTGGVTSRAQLVAATSRAAVDLALRRGELVVVARGRYAVPAADEALVAAHRRSAVVSHASAALKHGWQVRLAPEAPHVTVPRNRVVTDGMRRGVHLHWATLGPDDVDGVVTSRDRTLEDCLRTGPFADALCVADSALRDGYPRGRLSALVRDLAVVPQLPLRTGSRFLGRPDLVDQRLGIVLEADSFEWHRDRAALARDARRYNLLVVHGWLVLRFSWEDVMFHADDVRLILAQAVAERAQRCSRCGSAA